MRKGEEKGGEKERQREIKRREGESKKGEGRRGREWRREGK